MRRASTTTFSAMPSSASSSGSVIVLLAAVLLSGCGPGSTNERRGGLDWQPPAVEGPCDAGTQSFPSWDARGDRCLPACTTLAAGNPHACATEACPAGSAASGDATYDCEVCCLPESTTEPTCDPIEKPAPQWGERDGSCLPSCAVLAGDQASVCGEPACPVGYVQLLGEEAYDCTTCCVEQPDAPPICDPATQPFPDWGQRDGVCRPSCGQLAGERAATCAATACGPGHAPATNGPSYDCPVCCVADDAPNLTAATRWLRWSTTLTSDVAYANPFLDVTVTAELHGPNGERLDALAFWDGGNIFELRVAFPSSGRWTWETHCTDTSNAGLHGQLGTVDVADYTGANPLYRHGFVEPSADGRNLVHADATPFFWLGDTNWAATVHLSEAGFRQWVDDRAAKDFTLLAMNVARGNIIDTDGRQPWVYAGNDAAEHWDVEFWHKVDRELSYANDHGLVVFVNALIDLSWQRHVPHFQRLVEMVAARYAAHFVIYSSSMDDPYDPAHHTVARWVDAVAPRHLLTQHTGTSSTDPGRYYDEVYLDFAMNQSGHHGGDYERAARGAIAWHLDLYGRQPHKPVINGEAWYDGSASPRQAAALGYMSLLSGAAGYTYGTSEWQATDGQLAVALARQGSTYMKHLRAFFTDVDGGRVLRPRHDLVVDQAGAFRHMKLVAVTGSRDALVAFLPDGGSVQVNLTADARPMTGIWFDPTTGTYSAPFATNGGALRTFTSPWGGAMALLRLRVD